MRVCLVGKYPPIEGGVSTTTYWIARGLAARGHEVHVVTNADEVEPRYRIRLEAADAQMLQARFEGGGSVRVHHVEPFDERTMSHIPVSNPYVSRTASLATDVLRRYGCEVVLAYYFEPYGVAGWFAATATGSPLVLHHAGSDLDRLARRPDLAVAYKQILRDAAAVVTRKALGGRFLGMGVAPERIVDSPAQPLDPELFTAEGPRLDLDAAAVWRGADAAASHDVPTIGVYGKIGVTKGTLDLINALGLVADRALPFQFAMMVGAEFGELLQPRLDAAGIASRTLVLPYLPHWRVPEFIRACDAVCFLERDFPVSIHGPMVAREVLACGTCLVLSGEIADKQLNRGDMVSGVNLHLVDDPRDVVSLADTLATVLTDRAATRRMGAAGAASLAARDERGEVAAGWEAVLRRVTQPVSLDPPDGASARRSALEHSVPALLVYAERHAPDVVATFLASERTAALPDVALELCDALRDVLPSRVGSGRGALLDDAVCHLRARVRASYDSPDDLPPFAVVDALGGATLTRRTAGHLYPVRGNHVRVEVFAHDVGSVFLSAFDGAYPDDPLQRAVDGPTYVLFQKTPNLEPRELAVNALTVDLLQHCDGQRTLNELVEELTDALAPNPPDPTDRTALEDLVVSAVAELHRLDVLVLGRRDPVWGWHRGQRSDLSALPHLRHAEPERVGLVD
ncbi:glycosyltransferase [Nocardioides aequoreus]|uniref:glycosyltransferase n=1 Tax=Nocardioides aequoreus TaxID=397278 RepID=UPI001FDF01A1|nr:glycosyltransferase [Nocardioides aequoreus]